MVADTLGRRVSFLLSVVVLFATTLGYVGVAASGGSLIQFVLVSMLMGLGFTFYSGSKSACASQGLPAVSGVDAGATTVPPASSQN